MPTIKVCAYMNDVLVDEYIEEISEDSGDAYWDFHEFCQNMINHISGTWSFDKFFNHRRK